MTLEFAFGMLAAAIIGLIVFVLIEHRKRS
jgi:hypothetical protein